jgi:hypothetical protein
MPHLLEDGIATDSITSSLAFRIQTSNDAPLLLGFALLKRVVSYLTPVLLQKPGCAALLSMLCFISSESRAVGCFLVSSFRCCCRST